MMRAAEDTSNNDAGQEREKLRDIGTEQVVNELLRRSGKAAENQVQSAHDSGVYDGQRSRRPAKMSGILAVGKRGQLCSTTKVVREGFEPPTKGL